MVGSEKSARLAGGPLMVGSVVVEVKTSLMLSFELCITHLPEI